MTLVDLTHVIRSGMPVYPGDPTPPRIVRESEHGAGTHQSSALHTGCHAGTHIDLPLHFRPGEPSLEQWPPERFTGPAVVVDAPAGEIPAAVTDGVDLGAVDFLLLRTGWERRWGTDRYYAGWPYLSEALADRLAAAGLKGVGLGTPSIDPLDRDTCHRRLAAAGLVNIENLARLDRLPAGETFRLWILPLPLAGAEASPVRAVAEVAGPC